jgi:transglutaminase superfamily protein
MSVGTAPVSQVAVVGARGAAGATTRVTPERPVARLVTFAALALYCLLKWSTLLAGGSLPRLLGLLALALLLAGGRPLVVRHSRLLAAVATVVVLIAALPVAGVPLAWIVHVRIAVTANAIGEGLSSLPQVLVPYSGVNQWVTLVIVLGAAVLLFDAALLVAFAPGAMEDLRRAGAALPLVALAAVPTTVLRPRIPYLDGAVLFGLLVAFMWGERIGRRRVGGALGVCCLAVIAALFAAPALDHHKPWINYQALAGSLRPTGVDGFDWSQGYGPLDWPRSGRVVMEVQASHPDYWKAENLDVFNGVGWALGTFRGETPPPARSALKQWTQTIAVTVRDMRISEVIGAGTSDQPIDLPHAALAGASPGTWTTGSQLGPGDSYRVKVYAPNPTAAELAGIGAAYAGVPQGYLTIELPPSNGTPSQDSPFMTGQLPHGYQATLTFPPFHSRLGVDASGGPPHMTGAKLLSTSVYRRAYGLARRLAAASATPFRFVQAVERYLSHGFVYNEHPARNPYPLESFLFATRRGYCQQFAGSMALLLRLGGIPARVAVGFTTGHYDSALRSWLVTDYDAHAWVEAWFPQYGWVRFDPTPAADPARSGHTPISLDPASNPAATGSGLSASKIGQGGVYKRHVSSQGGRGSVRAGASSSSELPLIVALAALLAVALAIVAVATRPLGSIDARVAELEVALRRMGRPLPAGATLTWLERRVGRSANAREYVRALRLARFAGGGRMPTRSERRALRRQLRLGLGLLGGLRAVWALPPRWPSVGIRARRTRGA